MLGNVKTKKAAPVYWKSGIVNRVCTSPKASETRGVMLVVDDAKNVAALCSASYHILHDASHPLQTNTCCQ